MKKDLNYVAALEKAIAKKFRKETIVNPKANWDDEKEEEYAEQRKRLYEKEQKASENSQKLEKDGFLLPKHLINKISERVCSVCETYSFDLQDDVYMNKFECCHSCYIQWVEGREDRWLKGWRPHEKEQEKS